MIKIMSFIEYQKELLMKEVVMVQERIKDTSIFALGLNDGV